MRVLWQLRTLPSLVSTRVLTEFLAVKETLEFLLLFLPLSLILSLFEQII